MSDRKINIVSAFLLFTLLLSFSYLTLRIIYFIAADFPLTQKFLAFLLLTAETFGLIHSLGYFLNLIKVIRYPTQNIALYPSPPLKSFPPVAVLVPSYREAEPILHDTLICFYNLTYPNKQLYFLDDTRYDKPWDTDEKIQTYKKTIDEMCKKIGINLFRRKWRGAKAGIINDFLHYLDGQEMENLDYRPYQNLKNPEKPKYFVVFDADMNPIPDFIEPLVAHLENNPKMAFIQTPQYYSNFETNKVARSAGYQQAVFFEYVCEGKGLSEIIFCCGTNVLMNREVLMSVGGFDESSVTEDIATSFKMHLKGWKSLYYNRNSAFGLGPEDLEGYFKQQFRWALGTISLGRGLIKSFFKNYFKHPSPVFWWEYFLSYTHFFIGWIYFFMIMFPILYLFFSIPVFFMDPTVYLAVFFPYLALSLSVVFWSLRSRQLYPSQFFVSMLLTSITFPVYMQAAIKGVLGIKSTFVVTPKDKGSSALPLTALWIQITAMILCVAAFTWGVERMYYERESLFGLMGNIIWCVFNFGILSSIFYFNKPETA